MLLILLLPLLLLLHLMDLPYGGLVLVLVDLDDSILVAFINFPMLQLVILQQ